MKSDPDHKFEGTGETPADSEFPGGENSVGNNGGFRPFRSWGTAYETQATVWSRMRGRLAGMFSRNNNHGEDESTPALLTESKETASAGVAPPDNFKFPWASDLKSASDEVFSTVDDALPSDAARGGLRRALGRPGRWLQRLVSRTEKNSSSDHETRVGTAAHVLDDVSSQIAPASGPTSDLPLIEIEEIAARTDEFAVQPRRATVSDGAVGDGDTLELPPRGFFGSLWARVFGSSTAASEAAAEQGEAAKAAAGFLLSKFRAFYNEIIRFQHQKSEFTAGFATAVMAVDNPDAEPDAEAEGLSKRLSELLELQAAEAKWMGGEVAQRYPDAQFAMAALADELFSNAEWSGKASWQKFRLEPRLYRTHGADLEVFKRIDRLLKELPDSTVARDLARVYLLVLAAGFQGKWRPFGLLRPIAEYRRRLYEYVHGADPLMLYADDRRIFPDAVTRTVAGQAISRYSGAQRWAAILAFLIVTYTVVAHVAWSRASSDLKDVTGRIKASTSTKAR